MSIEDRLADAGLLWKNGRREGALLSVLVAVAPKRLAGDVGSIGGTTQNLASAVGTAVMGAVLVTTLGMGVGGAVAQHPELPESLVKQVDLDNANFISNDDLREVLARTPADPS
ncbi:hypothetical protein FAM23867_001428 [Propionibacterium freudenreichii]|nr:hypothetical protein [Propionibacterium freudenreichii]MDK9347575.1 hypothetical protein [Propionibacterium freudenreichii]SBM44082.1 Hypothetical protein PFR_JS2_1923 [Propionibacterium freudenreichii]